MAVEPFVVQGVEVGALALVGHGGRVADVVAALVVVAIVVVARKAILVVDLVDEDVVGLGTGIVLGQTFNVVHRVVEAGADHEGLVAELFAVLEGELAGIWVELGDLGLLDLGPVIDHGLGVLGVALEGLHVSLDNTEVALWLHPNKLVGHESHLQLVSAGVLLQVFDHGSRVGATYAKTRQRKIIMISRGEPQSIRLKQ